MQSPTAVYIQSILSSSFVYLSLFDNFSNVDLYKNDDDKEIGIQIEFVKGE